MIKPTFQDFISQGDEIQALQTQIRENRIVHAILISGDTGTGKRTLARLIAASLLCSSKGNQPCCQCNGCMRSFGNEHPDLIVIEKGVPITADAKKTRSSIPIDDIREMIRLCSSYPFEGGNRVILINNADDMTPQAQNCLLKILEEPPANTYFILTSSHSEKLLVTVRSRCRMLKMRPWDDDTIIRILTEEGIDTEKAKLAAASSRGSVGYAKQLAADGDYWRMREETIRSFFRSTERSQILTESSRWKDNKADADKLFDILEECVRTMLQFRIDKKEDLRMETFSTEWKKFAEETDYERFACLLNRICEARKQFQSNVSIQAIIEQLLLSFIGEIAK